MFNLAVINSLIEDTTAANVTLQPSSVILIGAMYETLSALYKWHDGENSELTPAQTDAIEAMVAQLYYDIATENEEVLPTFPYSFARVGMVFPVPSAIGAFDETGLLYCNGAIHQKDDYPLLYSILNAAYILTADTFVVPDLRGRMILGNGDGGLGVTYSMAARAGHHQHTLSVAEMPAHSHTQRRHSSGSGTLDGIVTTDTSSGTPVNTDLATAIAGSGSAHNNMPPYEVMRWYIVAT